MVPLSVSRAQGVVPRSGGADGGMTMRTCAAAPGEHPATAAAAAAVHNNAESGLGLRKGAKRAKA